MSTSQIVQNFTANDVGIMVVAVSCSFHPATAWEDKTQGPNHAFDRIRFPE